MPIFSMLFVSYICPRWDKHLPLRTFWYRQLRPAVWFSLMIVTIRRFFSSLDTKESSSIPSDIFSIDARVANATTNWFFERCRYLNDTNKKPSINWAKYLLYLTSSKFQTSHSSIDWLIVKRNLWTITSPSCSYQGPPFRPVIHASFSAMLLVKGNFSCLATEKWLVIFEQYKFHCHRY